MKELAIVAIISHEKLYSSKSINKKCMTISYAIGIVFIGTDTSIKDGYTFANVSNDFSNIPIISALGND